MIAGWSDVVIAHWYIAVRSIDIRSERAPEGSRRDSRSIRDGRDYSLDMKG